MEFRVQMHSGDTFPVQAASQDAAWDQWRGYTGATDDGTDWPVAIVPAVPADECATCVLIGGYCGGACNGAWNWYRA